MGLILKSSINVLIILIAVHNLGIIASPVDTKVSTSKPEIAEKPKPLLESELSLLAKPKQDDEIMDTANAMVFRPLFVYRKQQAQRRRIYENRPDMIRRRDPAAYYPYGYPSYGYPYYKPTRKLYKPGKKPVRREESEFPALF